MVVMMYFVSTLLSSEDEAVEWNLVFVKIADLLEVWIGYVGSRRG